MPSGRVGGAELYCGLNENAERVCVCVTSQKQ